MLQNIKNVIFNDKSTTLNPTKEFDFKLNYIKPNKDDYRVSNEIKLIFQIIHNQ